MDEVKKILEMVAEGKISTEDASRLIDALGKKPSTQIESKKGKKLTISIEKGQNEKPLVQFSIPLGIIKLGAHLIPKNAKVNIGNNETFDMSQINWQEVLDLASNGEIGDIINFEVNDSEKIRIHIYVE